MRNIVTITFENELFDISVGADCINSWPSDESIAQVLKDLRQSVMQAEEKIKNDAKIRAQKDNKKS